MAKRKTKLKDCKHHGQTEFAERRKGKEANGWRCKQCEYLSLKRRRHKLKQRLVDLYGGKCVLCGYGKCLRALQFHHRDPKTKEFSLCGTTVIGWGRLLEESKKCDLLCANCHAETEELLSSQETRYSIKGL